MPSFMMVTAENDERLLPLLSQEKRTPESLMELAKYLSHLACTDYNKETVQQLANFLQNAQPGEYFQIGKRVIIFALKEGHD